MGFSKVIVSIILFFMLVGIIDRMVFNNKYGYGPQFEAGIMAMGPLSLSMVGIMCLAPVMGTVIEPLIAPLYKLVGAEPAMIAGSLLAMDMGGYPLARAMSDNMQIQQLSGIYISTMMGATILFSIPVSLGIIEPEDKPYLAKGVLAGFVAIPFGVITSAMAAGIPFVYALINLVPSMMLAIFMAVGLLAIPDKMLKGFNVFSRIINLLILSCLGIAIIEALAHVTIIPGMDPIGPQLETVGVIAITLAGAYPMIHFITITFSKQLTVLGRFIGVNETAAAGIIACLANNIPMFTMIKDMDEKGKVITVAFSVCASFALGDHLGYASAINPSFVFPMIAGKIVGGAAAILFAKMLVLKP